jgi:predicted outer membrane repeat protein
MKRESLLSRLTLIVMLALFLAARAEGATFNADPLATDIPDVAPGNGICSNGIPAHPCSLRAAVMETNALAGADTINVPAGTYTLMYAGAGEDGAITGDLDITDASGVTTITGAGAATTIIDGNANDRIFQLMAGVTAVISKVTIRNGNGGSDGGGGIYARHLVADPVISLDLVESVVANNQTTGNGGGIYFAGDLLVDGRTISANTAGGFGGGIGSVPIGPTVVTNSTISGNTAQIGGGTHASGTGVSTGFGNSTVAFNTATLAGGGASRSNSNGGGLSFGNTIIANNTAPSGPDCYGAANVDSADYNLIGNTSDCTISGATTHNIYNPPGGAQLAPTLALNGSTKGTRTHALLVGSPAIAHSNPLPPGSPGNACTATDQRGGVRSSPVGTVCDIGAYETGCDNVLVDPGEACDGTSCCTAGCGFAPSNSACPDETIPNVCTNDVCNATGTCQHLPNTVPCNDGAFCNGPDTCAGGACLPTTPGFNPCNGGPDCNNTCNEAADNCFNAVNSPCAVPDANPCTNDVCNGAGSCNHPNNTAPCTDPLFCNGADTCSGGTCSQHAGNPCTAGPQCAHTCQEATDSCNDTAGTACNDANPCTTPDTCTGSGTCAGTQTDTDGDGILNPCDNCVSTSNPDQRNSDNVAGATPASMINGDACDVCPLDKADLCKSDQTAAGSIPPTGGTVASATGAGITCPNGARCGSCTDPAKSPCATIADCPSGTCGATTLSVTEGNVSAYGLGANSTNLTGGVAEFGPAGQTFNSDGLNQPQNDIVIQFHWLDGEFAGVGDGLVNDRDNKCVGGSNSNALCTVATQCPGGSCASVNHSPSLAEANLKAWRNGQPLGICSNAVHVLCAQNDPTLPCPGTGNCNPKDCGAVAQASCPLVGAVGVSALCCETAANKWVIMGSKFSEYAIGPDPCEPIIDAQLKLTKIGAPAGDDKLSFKGSFVLPSPTTVADLDPLAHGFKITLSDVGGPVMDLIIPSTAYDTVTRVGWRLKSGGTAWQYVNKSSAPPSGIVSVKLKDRSAHSPGLVQFQVKGSRGSFAATPSVIASLTLPDTGPCFSADFPGLPAGTCTTNGTGTSLNCR